VKQIYFHISSFLYTFLDSLNMSAPVRISLDSGQRSASDSEKKLETIPVVPLSDDVEKAPPVSVPVSDWSGPDDLLDPHNWSRGKRAYHVFPPAVISFVA
jgi:hypothetical protein